MSGNFIKQVFRKFGLGCMCAKSNTDAVEQVTLGIYSKITPGWLPNVLRPFLAGMFLPMLLLFYLNYQYFKNEFYVHWLVLQVLEVFMYVMIILFVVLGVRTGGKLKTDIWRYRSVGIITEKPYMKN